MIRDAQSHLKYTDQQSRRETGRISCVKLGCTTIRVDAGFINGESLNCCGEREEDVSFYGVWDFNATMRKGVRKKTSTTVTFTVRAMPNNVRL